jgi:large subunit ribosomal protein L18
MRGARSRQERVMSIITKENRRLKRRRRVRAKISGTPERPRISVFRSNRGLSAQLIDDVNATTLAAVNWFEPELSKLTKADRAKRSGELLAERAKTAGVSEAVFDRGGYRYHGHVKTFAEAIREADITV